MVSVPLSTKMCWFRTYVLSAVQVVSALIAAVTSTTSDSGFVPASGLVPASVLVPASGLLSTGAGQPVRAASETTVVQRVSNRFMIITSCCWGYSQGAAGSDGPAELRGDSQTGPVLQDGEVALVKGDG